MFSIFGRDLIRKLDFTTIYTLIRSLSLCYKIRIHVWNSHKSKKICTRSIGFIFLQISLNVSALHLRIFKNNPFQIDTQSFLVDPWRKKIYLRELGYFKDPRVLECEPWMKAREAEMSELCEPQCYGVHACKISFANNSITNHKLYAFDSVSSLSCIDQTNGFLHFH